MNRTRLVRWCLLAAGLPFFAGPARAAEVRSYDLVVYGGRPAA